MKRRARRALAVTDQLSHTHSLTHLKLKLGSFIGASFVRSTTWPAVSAAAGPSAAASTAGHVHSMAHSRIRSRVYPRHVAWWKRLQRSPGPENSETENE